MLVNVVKYLILTFLTVHTTNKTGKLNFCTPVLKNCVSKCYLVLRPSKKSSTQMKIPFIPFLLANLMANYLYILFFNKNVSDFTLMEVWNWNVFIAVLLLTIWGHEVYYFLKSEFLYFNINSSFKRLLTDQQFSHVFLPFYIL